MKDLAARDQLVLDHLGLAATLAKRAKLRVPESVDIRDLEQIGCIALLERATKYEPGRGVPFDAYARRRVYGAMIDSCRRRHYLNAKHVPLDDGISTPVERPDHDGRIDAVRTARALGQVVEMLAPRAKKVVQLYYREGRTHRAIAGPLQLGENRVGQIHRGALVEMKRGLVARGVVKAA